MDIKGFNTLEVREHAEELFKKSSFDSSAKKQFITEQLVKDRNRRKNLKRCMSIHVGSRWYRSPEVSLIER